MIPVATAVIGFFGLQTTDLIEKNFRKPIVKIQTKRFPEGININFEVDKASIESITLSYDIAGNIVGFENPNSVADVHASAFVIGGQTNKWVLNRVEIELKKIRPRKLISFTVKYRNQDNLDNLLKNMPQNQTSESIKKIITESIKKYKVSFIWNHKGERFYEDQWRLTENDNLTTQPKIITGGYLYFVPEYKAPPPELVPKRELTDTF